MEEYKVLLVEARINVLQVPQRADEEAGTDKQYERKGDLNNHESLAKPGTLASPELAHTTLELGAQIESSSTQGGR